MSKRKIDLRTLTDWEALDGGTYTIKLKSKASGCKTSNASESVTVNKLYMPTEVTLTENSFALIASENATSYEILCDDEDVGEIAGEPYPYPISIKKSGLIASASNPTVIADGGSVTLIFTADTDFKTPTSEPTVTNASYVYTRESDAVCSITISNPTDAVSINIDGVSTLPDYLEFSAEEAFTLTFSFPKHSMFTSLIYSGGSKPAWGGTLEYSTDDGSTWETYDKDTYKETKDSANYLTISSSSTNKILLRGEGNSTFGGSYGVMDAPRNGEFAGYEIPASLSLEFSTPVYCHGNIETLRGYRAEGSTNYPDMGAYCYRDLFAKCTLLSHPTLPATKLAYSCYFNTFGGQQTLADFAAVDFSSQENAEIGAFAGIFANSSITEAELKSIFPASGSDGYKLPYPGYYEAMFYNASIKTAPELPATTLTEECYYRMFTNCTSLETAPELPATTLASSCYKDMFSGCTSLTTAPKLPATTLAGSCYKNMFNGCTSLITIPDLPSATPAEYCYYGMFCGCEALTKAPKFTIEETAKYCCTSMFYSCSSLTDISNINLSAATLSENCYGVDTAANGYGMFENCTSLNSMISLPATTLAKACYGRMFYGCTAFNQQLTLPATTLAEDCYYMMFGACTSLTTAPELPATTLDDDCYYEMFYRCTSLTTASALPATKLAKRCYEYMFSGCTSLTIPPSLPATTLASYCYYQMFSACTSLIKLPKLLATTLTEECYAYMFGGCTNIKLAETQSEDYTSGYTIPYEGTGTAESYALSYMFASTGGTFTGTPTINTTYYTSNEVID